MSAYDRGFLHGGALVFLGMILLIILHEWANHWPV